MSLRRPSAGQHSITPYPLPSPDDHSANLHQPQTDDANPASITVTALEPRPSHLLPDLSRSSSVRSARLSSSFLPRLRLAGLVPDHDSERERERQMRSSRSRETSSRPKAILTLKLSGSSFLDTVIRDDKNKDPIYIVETSGENTFIFRLDHPRDEPVKTATIQWPLHPVRQRGKSGRSVQFGNGSWREAEELLKCGPLGNTAIRKFSLPHYPNSLKWKLIPGNCFCCVTSAVKGPLAVLDAATLSAPPRIKIYDPLIEKEVARSQDNYKGIPTVLLDYLVVTSLLLVTDVQEWLDRPREARIPGSSSYTIQRWLALIHNRQPPPEPEHPTVDLSLTVPSTPPHSATFPSPGGMWETQSGVTSMSGSNGSGSGASCVGDLFTPTTPATSATSAHSSAFFSRSPEDVPPLPPLPGSSSGTSPFAFNVESSRLRERPKSNPQTLSHSESPSSSTSTSQTARPPSLPANVQVSSMLSSFSTSEPASPYAGPSAGPSSASSSSASRLRRQLPTPPGPTPQHSFAQPWLYSAGSSPSSSSPVPIPMTPPTGPTSIPVTPIGVSSATSPMTRASMRTSIRSGMPPPPPPPPPQHEIPLPPKLAQEQQATTGFGQRPRTAPEPPLGTRRRHSTSEFGEFGIQDDVPASTHPYAVAAQTFSNRGREFADHEVNELSGHMHGLSMSAMAGPSTASMSHMGHMRAPSVAAPDYDAHSFVNVAPPPPPPTAQGSSGMRSPLSTQNRRVLTAVNPDDGIIPEHRGQLLQVERERRTRTRMSFAESVYEHPPPAYDAIDFSVPPMPPPVPSVPPISSTPQMMLHQLPPTPTPLPAPPVEAGWEGQRGS